MAAVSSKVASLLLRLQTWKGLSRAGVQINGYIVGGGLQKVVRSCARRNWAGARSPLINEAGAESHRKRQSSAKCAD